jgi:hypothetical protein
MAHHPQTSGEDVDQCIRPASAAFGALKSTFQKEDGDLKGKRRTHIALCLSIQKFGACGNICLIAFAISVIDELEPCAYNHRSLNLPPYSIFQLN